MTLSTFSCVWSLSSRSESRWGRCPLSKATHVQRLDLTINPWQWAAYKQKDFRSQGRTLKSSFHQWQVSLHHDTKKTVIELLCLIDTIRKLSGVKGNWTLYTALFIFFLNKDPNGPWEIKILRAAVIWAPVTMVYMKKRLPKFLAWIL